MSRVPRFLLEAYKHTQWTRLLHSSCLFPVSVCLSSGALLSFLVISHLPLSVSLPYIFFLFIVSFSVHPFFVCPPTSSCLLFRVLFLLTYSSQTSHCTWLKGTCFSLPTADCLYYYISSPLAHIRERSKGLRLPQRNV